MEKAKGGVVWVAKEFKAAQKLRFDLLSHSVTPLLSFDNVRTGTSDLGRTGSKDSGLPTGTCQSNPSRRAASDRTDAITTPMHTARFLVYEIPISRPTVPSRFFMASTPTFSAWLNAVFELGGGGDAKAVVRRCC